MIIYFKAYAKEHGCDCLDKGDLAIWNWILVYQGKDPIEVN